MRYEFTLDCKPFSVNAYRYRDARFKTKEARAWESEVLELLEEHKTLHDMADMWRISGGTFFVSLKVTYPTHIFYNKAGNISSKTIDITNYEKPLVDLIFNNFMNVDDRFIESMFSEKSHTTYYSIEVVLEFEPYPPR